MCAEYGGDNRQNIDGSHRYYAFRWGIDIGRWRALQHAWSHVGRPTRQKLNAVEAREVMGISLMAIWLSFSMQNK
jgi:hypothetical protein